MAAGSTGAILKALGANSGIALAKAAGWFFTGSTAMLAEAIHSLADCANQALLLVGMKQAQAPVTDERPMGSHRAVYVMSMVVALLLFFVGGAFSLYEGVTHALHPEPVKYAVPAMVILAVSILLEAWSLKGALDASQADRAGKTLLQWFKETRQSDLLVVTGEDIAALGGLVFAFIAIGASYVTGNPVYDALGSCAVGLLLMVVAVFVMVEVNSLLVGESVAPGLRAEILAFVNAQPEVEKVYNMIAMALGNKMFIALKVNMYNSDVLTGDQVADAVDAVEERIQQKFPDANWVFFEIDRDRD